MKIVRILSGKTLRDTERSENMIRTCWIDNINDRTLDRKIKWNEHIDQMTKERVVKIARDKLPAERRSLERPRKRWNNNLPDD